MADKKEMRVFYYKYHRAYGNYKAYIKAVMYDRNKKYIDGSMELNAKLRNAQGTFPTIEAVKKWGREWAKRLNARVTFEKSR